MTKTLWAVNLATVDFEDVDPCSFDEVVKYLGGVNKTVYGVNPF